MNELEQKIKAAQDAYYDGNPIMEDYQYDELYDKLIKEYPDSKLLKAIGADTSNVFAKREHFILMGSQNKANSKEEIEDWLKKINYQPVIVSEKLDGISLEIVYLKGGFQAGITRGDGKEGFNITSNVVKMMGIPNQIDKNFTGSVRGEILLFKSQKDKYFPDMKNCRNTAAGLSKRLDGIGCEYLNVVCYDAQSQDDDNYFKTQEELQKWLIKNKFDVAKYYLMEKPTSDDLMSVLNETFENIESLEYDIDGLVIKQNKIDIEDFKTNLRPKTTIALKPKRTYKTSVLRNIEWNQRNGTFTPVGVFDTVDLLGASVSRASLGNIDILLEMGIEIGHTIEITRCGEIIPKITRDMTTGKFRKGYEH